ncbi:hypothetical protein SAY86_020486 [Trapa natans]|uniref:4a-hydroxytetrahydrobiopterin dehydratase n=1 Tax=Trapa natans TaxID=22666 RepID=A0AAN7R489_TRANT|nr:hypothetical protein SAY86_020486 [Trapa natans]
MIRRMLLFSRPSASNKLQVPFLSVSQSLFPPDGRSSLPHPPPRSPFFLSTTQNTEITQNHVPCSSNRKQLQHGFRTFCTSEDLAAKKCIPCNVKDLRPMTGETAHSLISKVEGWKLLNEGGVLKLNRTWKVKSFTKGLELFQLVARVAEVEGHHPDLHLVGWNNVTIEIWTHAVGGLTENDFILAAKINGLPLHGLLRGKVKDSSTR